MHKVSQQLKQVCGKVSAMLGFCLKGSCRRMPVAFCVHLWLLTWCQKFWSQRIHQLPTATLSSSLLSDIVPIQFPTPRAILHKCSKPVRQGVLSFACQLRPVHCRHSESTLRFRPGLPWPVEQSLLQHLCTSDASQIYPRHT